MPIISLQQSATSVREGMNEIGKIRKGAPKEKDRPGEDLKYFRVILNPQYTHLQPVIDGLWGTRPEWFEGAHVLEDTADKAFTHWMEQWGGGGTLYHRCEGPGGNQVQHYNGQAYSFARIACKAPLCECQRVARLALWFDDFVAATGEFGYFTVFTSSKNDIVETQRQLATAEYLAARAGMSLIAVPFIFGRFDKAISSPAFKKQDGKWIQTDKRTLIVKSLFNLRIDPRWTTETLLPAIHEAPMLPPPSDKPVSALGLADRVKMAKALGAGGPDASRRIDTGFNQTPAKKEPEIDTNLSAPPDVEDEDVIEGQISEAPPESDLEADETTYELTQVREAVRFLFNDDETCDLTIAALIKGGEGIHAQHVIKANHTTLHAALCVLLHEIRQVFGLDTLAVQKLIKEQTHGTGTIKDYIAAGHSLQDVWGLVRSTQPAGGAK